MLVVAIFLAGVVVMRLTLTDATVTELFNYNLSQIDAAGENVDMIFLGDSRTYRGLDPDVFEDEMGLDNVVNNGTPQQRPTLSYYLLKDMLEKYHPKYVLLSASFNGISMEQEPHYFYFAVDRMGWRNKLRCLIDYYGINQGLLTLVGKSEYINNMSLSAMKENVITKMERSRGEFETKKSVMKMNGFKSSLHQSTPGSISYSYNRKIKEWSLSDINAENLEYMNKIIDLCKSNDIEVILFTPTTSLSDIYRVEDYQIAIDYYNEYARKHDLKYFNLNYIRDRETIFPDEMFEDNRHMNYYGSQKCSKIFTQILNDYLDGKNTDHYFYKDLDELQSDVKRIVGCGCSMLRSNENYCIYTRALNNEGVVPEYRLLATKDNDKEGLVKQYNVIREWTEESKFVIPCSELEGYKNIKVEARSENHDEVVAFDTYYIEDVKE